MTANCSPERSINELRGDGFCRSDYFRHELPCDPSSLVRWRKRIGEAGCEWLLAHSIEAATKAGVIKRSSLQAVVLDTTVQPKAISPPDRQPTAQPCSRAVGGRSPEGGGWGRIGAWTAPRAARLPPRLQRLHWGEARLRASPGACRWCPLACAAPFPGQRFNHSRQRCLEPRCHIFQLEPMYFQTAP
jgi:hypothetical protein